MEEAWSYCGCGTMWPLKGSLRKMCSQGKVLLEEVIFSQWEINRDMVILFTLLSNDSKKFWASLPTFLHEQTLVQTLKLFFKSSLFSKFLCPKLKIKTNYKNVWRALIANGIKGFSNCSRVSIKKLWSKIWLGECSNMQVAVYYIREIGDFRLFFLLCVICKKV